MVEFWKITHLSIYFLLSDTIFSVFYSDMYTSTRYALLCCPLQLQPGLSEAHTPEEHCCHNYHTPEKHCCHIFWTKTCFRVCKEFSWFTKVAGTDNGFQEKKFRLLCMMFWVFEERLINRLHLIIYYNVLFAEYQYKQPLPSFRPSPHRSVHPSFSDIPLIRLSIAKTGLENTSLLW